MKVLMQIRENYLSNPGGDTIQMQKTKEHLEKIGIQVDVSTELEPCLDNYDVVHLFNLTRIQETFIQARNCIKRNKKYVLSTIYWPFNEINEKAFSGFRGFVYKHFSDDFIESLKALYKFLFKKERNKGCRYLIFHKCSKMQKYVIENARVCLPNAMTEMDKIQQHLKVSNCNVVVVPNAIDVDAVRVASLSESKRFNKYKDYLVCVARISKRKNQVLLLDALSGTDYHILFVGKSSIGEQPYYHEFLSKLECNDNAEYIESIPNNDLYLLYKECKVSVLPSWFETPGLVSLEAAVMGCNIVVSDKGTTKDYFKDYAFYCSGMDKDELLEQINCAYQSSFNPGFQKLILDNYTWEKAAENTLRGYKMAIYE